VAGIRLTKNQAKQCSNIEESVMASTTHVDHILSVVEM